MPLKKSSYPGRQAVGAQVTVPASLVFQPSPPRNQIQSEHSGTFQTQVAYHQITTLQATESRRIIPQHPAQI